MTLSDFINEAYQNYGGDKKFLYKNWSDIGDFIYEPNKCLELLYHYLDLGYEHSQKLNIVNLNRCQHIVVTFLIGLGIDRHFNLLHGVNVINKMPDEYLWMLTSIIHDYGYLKHGVAECSELSVIDKKWHLLRDDYAAIQLQRTCDYSSKFAQYLTYSYETIICYYDYARNRLNGGSSGSTCCRKSNERVDHGIYGACKCYEEYCDFYVKNEYPRYCVTPSDDKNVVDSMGYEVIRYNTNSKVVELARTEPLLYKTSCLIAAQHNMFRSPNPDSDKDYGAYGLEPLLSTAPIVVTKKNALLYLLSIVDTLECTKRFERMYFSDKKNNCHEFGLDIKCVLDNVNIHFEDNNIIVDYSPLKQYIDSKRFLCYNCKKHITLHDVLTKHIKSVVELNSWVACNTKNDLPYKIDITIM